MDDYNDDDHDDADDDNDADVDNDDIENYAAVYYDNKDDDHITIVILIIA